MARRTGSSRLACALIATACITSARSAAADASPADQAMAQSLFDEARKLMASGDYAHACPKFAESQRLDPGGGTILNLALCHEGQGKTASAWTEFNEALSQAIRDGRPEREARARERIAVLEPKLSRLTVSMGPGAPADVQLTVDGASWGSALRGVAVPLDPGPHVVVAQAAGQPPWSTTVNLGPNADAKTVEVAAPTSAIASTSSPATPRTDEPSAPAPVETPAEVPSESGGNGRRTAGWIVGGAGLVAVGVGSVFGVMALSKRSDSNADCQSGCTQQGVNLNNQAITDAWVSDFGIGLGVIGVVAGAYLLWTSGGDARPATTTSGVHFLPRVMARGGGAALTVDWR
jgi:hypothetical protein